MSQIEKLTRAYKINTTGDACTGDNIVFVKRIWERRPINSFGKLANVVEGEIIKDSHGRDKQQHTFTVLTKESEKILIKGRNLYGIGVWRKEWKDESE